jgi:hypothetical protein
MIQDKPTASNPPPGNRPNGFAFWISEWNARNPVLAILLVSLLAVAVNFYPVIFCGRSYVACSGPLVYNWWPPLPGMAAPPEPTQRNNHGSDVAAMMWWGVPAGFIESRSLLDHGELPLWDRYGHAGYTFIGQAVSMLGDPLQLIVIIGRGSSVAWDIKFVAAKFLFCVGFGLLIRRLLDNRVLAVIYSALAAYCGAFFYINNHPAFFVFVYAPWILLAAIEWLDLRTGANVRWGIVWLLANFACFNGGHLEVAVVLIGGLNLAAVAHALAAGKNSGHGVKVLCRITAGTLLFLGLTAPVWMSFLVSLGGSYTAHDKILVQQLPPTALPGVFDDLFFLLLRPKLSDPAVAPGTSLLVFAGCCFSILRWRQLKGEPFFWVNTGAILLWGGCAFGWVPSSLLILVPLINRVGHNYTDFSYLLVVHLTIQSAYGFKTLANVDKPRQVAGDVVWIAAAFTGLFVLYACGFAHWPIPWNYFLCAGAGALGAPLLFVFLKGRRQQNLAFGWAGIFILGFIPNFRFGLYNFGNDTLLMLPGPRVTLNSPSPAVEKIKTDTSEPFRVIGLQWNFIGDYAAVYGLEDFRSCAPLSNREYFNLIKNFPGTDFTGDWMIQVANPARAQPLLNLLNVKYLLSVPSMEIGGQMQAAIKRNEFQITDRSDFDVYQNVQAWPRAFFENQVVAIASNEEFIKHLVDNARQPFIALTPAEIEKQPVIKNLETTNQAVVSPATNYLLSVNSTEFDIHASSAGVVCLTEGQANDFTATADNEPKPVLTVNRAFKGVYLDQPGDYHIKFTYRPRHWRLACALFWISIGAVIIRALTGIIRVRRAAKPDGNR